MDKLSACAENPRCASALLALLGLLMFLPGFFTIPPIDRDEARFAQASKQMIESGNYVDIHLQNGVRYKKPIGIYWLQVAATKIFGAPPYNEIWTYRVPSLLAAIVALILTYLIGRTLVSSAVGFGAALLMSSALILSAEARLAKTDAVLLAVTLLAILQLAKAYMSPSFPRKWESIIFWLAIAAGILIKGPVILMVVGLTILALCIMQKSPQMFLRLRPISGFALTLLCVAPWLIAITVKSHGLFWQESVGHDMLAKVAGGQESHGLPPGAHLAFLLLLFSPAIIAVIRGLIYGWRARADRVTQFLLAWIVPSWIIFELVPTKLPHYTLPLYTAIALLAAIAILKVDFSAMRKRLAFAVPVAIALALNIVLLGFIAPNLQSFWIAPQLQTAAHGRPVILVGYAEPSAVFLLGTQTQLLADGAAAAAAMQKSPQAVAAVSTEKVNDFILAAARGKIGLRIISTVNGFNLGRGKRQMLIIYQETP